MRITQAAAYFPVHDVAAALSEWTQVYGFTPNYVAGAPPEFAIASHGDARVMFRKVAPGNTIVPNEAQGGTWDLFCWVDDADEWSRVLSARGATVVYGPIDQASYHMREFAVRDKNGYVIGFGHALPSALGEAAG